MRPSGSTAVASVISMPAPESARLPRCSRCQSEAQPSCAEYWHIGATMIRLRSGVGPSAIGENSSLMLKR